MFKLLNFKIFYHPDSPPSSGGGMLDIIDSLASDDKPEILELKDKPKEPKLGDKELPKDDKKAKEIIDQEADIDDADKDKDDKEEEEDEVELILKDLEEDDAEPSEEDLEIATPVRRREILKKYPQLFKDFPYLEKAYFREQQFTQIFPTIDEAKSAIKARDALTQFENDLSDGNLETVLAAVKDQDVNAFYRIVDNYLPVLAKVDQKAYHTILGNFSKHIIRGMVSEARKSKNETLESAAAILNQYMFGTSEWSDPVTLASDKPKEENPKEAELNNREREFARQRFNDSREDLNRRVTNSLRATIDEYIDPKESMTPYVKKNATREAEETLAKLMTSDKRFSDILDRLWEKAIKSNFKRENVDAIRSAYLSKAKTLLPSVIKKARNEALRGMGKKVRDDDEEPSDKKGPITPGRPRSQSSDDKSGKGGKIKLAAEIPRGMTSLEFLNQD